MTPSTNCTSPSSKISFFSSAARSPVCLGATRQFASAPDRKQSGDQSKPHVFMLEDVTKVLDTQRQLFKNVTLQFLPGAKIGMIGVNGSGKSSLLKIMAGIDDDYTGTAKKRDGIKMGYLHQEPVLDETKTVYDNIMDVLVEQKTIMAAYEKCCEDLGQEGADYEALLLKQEELGRQMDDQNLWDLDRHIQIAMDALRCPPAESSVVGLSGGERRRIALCRLLLMKPDFLLLDEPTNHLDTGSVAWLENYLKTFPGTLMLVTHDRYFLDNIVDWVLELDRGSAIPFRGNYSEWLLAKSLRLAQEKKEESTSRKNLDRELSWRNSAQAGNRAHSKARLKDYDKLKQKVSDQAKSNPMGHINLPPGPRLGQVVLEVKNLSKSINGNVLFENFNLMVGPGTIIGIIGPNGAGKTTLFRTLLGHEKPDSGTVTWGETTKIGWVDQTRHLNKQNTVCAEISDGKQEVDVGGYTLPIRTWLAAFNFRGKDQDKPISMLSGGERNRLFLAKMVREGPNVLLLDEPTNDLDLEVLRRLEESLLDFPGCAIVISHDRWFLDRVCTNILSFDGDSKISYFDGSYSELERYRAAEGKSLGPKPVRFKKLVV